MYRCGPGYQLLGQEVRTCTPRGWSGEVPQCDRVLCTDRPTVLNAHMADLGENIVTFTCSPGYTTGDPAVTEFQSSCDSSGNWSAVSHQCLSHHIGYTFGEDPRKDFLVIVISGIFLIIAVSSIALASRMIIIRVQTKRGFFLRNPNYQSTVSDSVETLKTFTSDVCPSPIQRKDSATAKKVSLILKIEEEKKTGGSQRRKHSIADCSDLLPRPALAHVSAVSERSERSPVPPARSVQLCVMSHSSSSLPLPESNITMVSTNFATLSRRARREKTEVGNIRHSRTFSTFQPVTRSSRAVAGPAPPLR